MCGISEGACFPQAGHLGSATNQGHVVLLGLSTEAPIHTSLTVLISFSSPFSVEKSSISNGKYCQESRVDLYQFSIYIVYASLLPGAFVIGTFDLKRLQALLNRPKKGPLSWNVDITSRKYLMLFLGISGYGDTILASKINDIWVNGWILPFLGVIEHGLGNPKLANQKMMTSPNGFGPNGRPFLPQFLDKWP